MKYRAPTPMRVGSVTHKRGAEIEVSDSQAKDFDRRGWKSAAGKAEKQDPQRTQPPLTAAELLEKVDEFDAFFAFKSAAKDILGDDCPEKKADIIAALELRAEQDKKKSEA